MLFLVDESTGKAVVRHLRHLGYDVLAAGEIMPQADDPHVLTLALQAVGSRRFLHDTQLRRGGWPYVGRI